MGLKSRAALKSFSWEPVAMIKRSFLVGYNLKNDPNYLLQSFKILCMTGMPLNS